MENNDDIYCTLNYNNKLLIYGGNDSILFIKDFETEQITELDLDIKDSIIMIRFHKNLVYILTLDGEIIICKIVYDEEKFSIEKYKTFSIKEDVCSFLFSKINKHATENNKNEKKTKMDSASLIVGTNSGNIYYFYDEVDFFKMYFGHTSSVLELSLSENNLFSVSDSKFVIADVMTGENLVCRESFMLKGVKSISDSTYLILSSKNLRIFKIDKLIKKIDKKIECCVVKDNQVFIGGEGLFSLSDINCHNIFEYQAVCEEELNISKIKIFGNIIICTSYEKIGIADFREGKIEFFDLNIGGIFDFTVYNNEIIAGGEDGIGVINMDNN